MPHLISVEPFGDGWSVKGGSLAEPLMFTSGGRAETAARQLGERLAAAGEAAEIRIYARGGAMVGRVACTPFTVLERCG